MSKRLLIAFGLVGICAGILIGESLIGMIAFRRVLGHLTRRGELAAVVAGHGIYESDITVTATSTCIRRHFANHCDFGQIIFLLPCPLALRLKLEMRNRV